MKKLSIFILLMICCRLFAVADIIRNDLVWRYVAHQTWNKSTQDYDTESIIYYFSGHEVINDKKYSYLVGAVEKNLSLYLREGMSAKFGDILFYYSPSVSKWTSDNCCKRLFLMREEDGKVYLFNDKKYQFTEPIDSSFIKYDLSEQPKDWPDEFLIYDFNTQAGESFSSVLFDIKGHPCISEVLIKDTKDYNYPNVLSYTGQKVTIKTQGREDYELTLSSLTGYIDAFLAGFSELAQTGFLMTYFNMSNTLTYHYLDKTISYTNQQSLPSNYIFECFASAEDNKKQLTTYRIFDDKKSDQQNVKYLARIKSVTWDESKSDISSVENTYERIVKYRKTDGKIFVIPSSDWIDEETDQPFAENVELLYANMNMNEGEVFTSFILENNKVRKFEKKVFAVTRALTDDGSELKAFFFEDDNGEPDQTSIYIDGIGFYGPEAGMTVFNGAKLNNIYNEQGEVIVKGEDVKIPEYVGIYDVTASKDSETIYSIDGLRMNCHRSELPAGFYIINGKKVIVK